MKAASQAGAHGLVWFVLAAVVGLRLRRFAPIFAVTAAELTGSFASTALKNAIGRARPPLADAQVHPLVALPSDASLPSGHATTAFACATVLCAFAPRARPLLLGLALLIAVSRVYLGVHYPSDVIAGALLGTAVGLAVVLVSRRALPPSSRAPSTRSRRYPSRRGSTAR